MNGVNLILANLDEDRKDKTLHTDVYFKLKSLANSHPNDVEIIWRLARSCHDCSNNATELETEKEFIFEGKYFFTCKMAGNYIKNEKP